MIFQTNFTATTEIVHHPAGSPQGVPISGHAYGLNLECKRLRHSSWANISENYHAILNANHTQQILHLRSTPPGSYCSGVLHDTSVERYKSLAILSDMVSSTSDCTNSVHSMGSLSDAECEHSPGNSTISSPSLSLSPYTIWDMKITEVQISDQVSVDNVITCCGADKITDVWSSSVKDCPHITSSNFDPFQTPHLPHDNQKSSFGEPPSPHV